MSNNFKILLVVAILASSFMMMVGGCSYMMSSFASKSDFTGVSNSSKDGLGLVKIEGTIMNSMPVINQLQKLSENSSVKGILVRVNSPGGAVGASQEIMDYIAKVKESGIPIVASYANVSASGGLYSTLSSNKIFANPGTITGSIGVITQFIQGRELIDKIGIDMVTFKSGELKDAGSPFRPVTKRDTSYFQGVIDETYAQFKDAILKYRKIEADSLDKYADGRILTGSQAYEIGLIDSVGGVDVALQVLADLAGLDEVPSDFIKIKPKKSFLKQMLEEPVADIKESLAPSAKLMYLLP